jgi:hypothetical protein
MKVPALGSVDIFIRSGHVIDPYFHLPTSSPLDGWRNIWFFLRNNSNVPLPMFSSRNHVPQPNWEYNVAQRDLRSLQPLHEVVQKLLRGGLTGAELLRTFINHRVQLLRRREVTMWMYQEPSCPDCPFSTEFGDTEINTRIEGFLLMGLI